MHPEIYHLTNDRLRIAIASKGAELQSIFNIKDQLEYMWSGDPVFWGKKSPVLFPIVGGLKNNSYRYQHKVYSLGRHGFARDRQFSITSQSANSITFSLETDTESLQVYPFRFRFSITYTLDKNCLQVSYLVENTDKDFLYFSVGAHPAFAVPLVNGTSFSDHYLAFNKKETACKWPLSADGLIETFSTSLLKNEDRLPLSKELFYGDALVFKGLESTAISIRNNKNQHGLTLHFEDFPYMGIWSAKDADFVCIEPWCGIADSVNTTTELTQKEGINVLEAGEPFMRKWMIEVF